MIADVHFTINRNKQGWYVTEIVDGAPHRVHGPLDGPITVVDAMSYLIANNTLT